MNTASDRARRIATALVLLLLLAFIPDATSQIQLELVPLGSSWKYLDDGSDQGTVWSAPGFDDAGWAVGPAQLGYGDGDEATVVGFGGNPSDKFPTTYFRHEYFLADATPYIGLALELIRDDGAVVYSNGVEIARSNMRSGAIDFETLSAGTISGGSFHYDFNAHIRSGVDRQLVPGFTVYSQFWFRDPGTPGGTALSPALQFRIQP